MNKVFVAAALLCLSCIVLSAQTQQGGDDLDGLFTGDGTPSSGAAAGSADTTAPAPAVRADDPTRDQGIHYFASLDIYGLVGLGWSGLPDPGDLNQGLGHEGSGAMTASLGIDIRPARQLRLRGTLSYSFPKTGTQLSQLIVDYSIRDAVFFQLGIFGYTWGNSQFFQFTDLPGRSLSGWGVDNVPLWQQTNIIARNPTTNQPVSIKMSIPFGLDNLTLLARFDMLNYGFPDSTTPDPLDAGYGAQFDLVTGPIEWTIAGFWQRLLTPRTSLSMKTSLLGFDFSVETTMAFPVRFTADRLLPIETTGGGIYVGGVMQRIYPTAVVGVSREWTDARIKLYAEYAYNGERDPGTSWLADDTGPGGHNSAVVLRFRDLGDAGISLNLLWQQNWSDGSGLVSPLLEISPVPLTTIQFGPVFVYDIRELFGEHPDSSEVISNRLVPGKMRAELLLLVKISDSFRQ